MGSQFRLGISSQQDQRQQEWVPRSQDQFGGGAQGARLVAQVFGEDVMFAAVAIADTETHQPYNAVAIANNNPTGVAFDQAYAPWKTGVFTSTLNEAVTLQPVWSRDGATWFAFGTTTTIDAYTTGAPQSAIVPLSTPSQYVPFVGCTATCATAPTSGAISGWVERLG